MNKAIKITLVVVGIILLANGILNIIDDSRILAYDITSILSGIGFVIVSLYKKA